MWITLYCIVMYCNVLYCIVLYCVIMQDTILYCNGDLGNDMCGLHCIVLYCIVYVAYVVFTLCVLLSNDKFHVRLSHDRIMDLRNDINMYVCMFTGKCIEIK